MRSKGLLIFFLLVIPLTMLGEDLTSPTVATSPTVRAELEATTPTRTVVTSPEDEAIRFLKMIEVRHGDVRTVVGRFEQLKRSKVFLEEIKSTARFYFKRPGKFRCDYFPPNESINLVVNGIAWLYVPEIKQVEKYRLAETGSKVDRLNQLLLGLGVSVKDILEVYDVRLKEKSDKEIAIEFRLKEPEEGINFEAVTIWFDRKELLPRRIYIDELGDDETFITIKKLELNASVSDSLFKPLFPKDVEIIEHY